MGGDFLHLSGGAPARDQREVFVYLSGRRITKFSSTFFKRWRDSKGRRPLAAIRRWRNAFYFRRIWGFGGLCKRKAPKAPLFYAHLGGGRPPRWGGGPVRGRRGPSLSGFRLPPQKAAHDVKLAAGRGPKAPSLPLGRGGGPKGRRGRPFRFFAACGRPTKSL